MHLCFLHIPIQLQLSYANENETARQYSVQRENMTHIDENR